jgi:hypothetical protein
METQPLLIQLIEHASRLGVQDFEKLFDNLNLIRAQRKVPNLSKSEADLLKKINEGFSLEKRARLITLDEKMEFSQINKSEAEESLKLATELENYTVQRFIYLKKLAALRKISIDQLMQDLDILPRKFA